MPLKVTLAPEEETELSDECLVKMGEVTLHTRKVERGCALCYREGKVVPSYEHHGGRWSISYKDCTGIGPKAGSFHTHAISDSRPSWYDGYSLLSNSHRHRVHWLSCVGSPRDMTVRCYSPKEIPPYPVVQIFHAERGRHVGEAMEHDRRLTDRIPEVATFGVRDIPKMLTPKVPVALPVPAPRIREEQVDFQTSKFIKYINEETGEVIRTERVY